MKVCVFLLTVLIVSPALAGPIFTSVDGGSSGCISALPAAGAYWESAGHFQFAVFWDDNLTCEATIANGYAPYHRYDNFDGTGGLRIEMFQADLIPCKKYQIDWRKVYDDGSVDPVQAILINPIDNPECQSGSTPYPPAPTPTRPVRVPEAHTLLLIATGLVWFAQRRHRARTE
jgi:hypothetical protein